MNITIFNKKTGEIIKNVSCPLKEAEIQCQSGEDYINQKSDDLLQYVKDGKVVNKQSLPCIINKTQIANDGIDLITIKALPNPTKVYVDNNIYTVTDDTFEFTSEVEGKYKIKCVGFPYLDKEYTITCE